MMKRLTLAALALLMAVGVLLTGSTGVALAGPGGGPNISDEYQTGGTGKIVEPPPSSCPGGCPKVSYTPYGPPTDYYFRYNTTVYEGNPQGITCAPKADGRVAITVTTRSVGRYGNMPDAEVETYNSVIQDAKFAPTSWCNYQPQSVVGSKTITCPINITGSINGPFDNPTMASGQLSTVDTLSPWAAAGRTGTDCSGTFSAGLGKAVAEAGHYRLDLAYASVSCTVRTYSGTQPDEINTCGKVTTSSRTKWITVSCTLANGWADRYVGGIDFSVNACQSILWSCTTPKPTYDNAAYALPLVHALADGIHRSARWDAEVINGVQSLGNFKTYLSVDRNGAPYRTTLTPNSPDQPMEIARNQGGNSVGLDTVQGGEVLEVFVGWQEGSTGDKNSVLNRRVTFDGMFPSPKLVMPSIDAASGAILGGYTTTSYVAGTGSCNSMPLVADVARGRNVN
jgi:hypothetical protein